MNLQISPFGGKFHIGLLLLLVTIANVAADIHGTQQDTTQQTVKVTGTVVDSDTGLPLPAVKIRVANTQIRVTTDETGRFSADLTRGTYTLRVSAPFYNSYAVVDLQVKIGETPEPLRISLVPQVVKLDAIKMPVRLSQSSERGLLEQRMRSSRIEDSISTEEISRLPASSAGEAIKRVTGVSIVGERYVFVRGLGERYSNTLLNNVEIPSPEPNRRVVPMDIFPPSLLASLQTMKTFSPDQPGGFAGGSVQVFTKDFPEELTRSFSISTSFNTQATGEEGLTYPGGDLDFLGFDDGSRKLPNLIEDRAADLPIRERGRFTSTGFTPQQIQEFGQSFENVWSPERQPVPLNQGYKLSLGNSRPFFGKQIGYLGVISYGNGHSYGTQTHNAFRIGLNEKLSPITTYNVEKSSNEVDWGGVLNTSLRFSPQHQISLRSIFTHTAEDETRIWQGFNADRNTDMRSARLRYVERQLFSGQIAGTHHFNPGEPPPDPQKTPDLSMEWRLTYSRASRDEPDTRENIYEDQGDGTFTFRDITHSGSRFFFNLEDNEYNARADWKAPINTHGTFKWGGILRNRSRTFDVRRFRFLPSDRIDNTVNLSSPPEMLFQTKNIAPRVFELRESTRSNDNYLADHNIYAGYLMINMPISSKGQVMIGIRLESSTQKVTTYDPFAASRMEIEANLETLDLLPGLNVTYHLAERMNLRLAASRTITRPDFRELAPFEFTDFVGGRTILGNPKLERTQINNFDIRWETFPHLGGILAASIFYKQFRKPIEQIVQPQAEVRITYENAKGANNYGLEIEARQNLGTITPTLHKFSINTNAALISSRVVLPEGIGIQTSSERPLQGQCPYILNVSIGYEDPNWGMSGTIAYNIFGQRLAEVGNHGVPDVYEQPRGQLDASFSRTIANYFKISFSAKNLLDPNVHFKQGEETSLRYKIGRSFSLAISYNL